MNDFGRGLRLVRESLSLDQTEVAVNAVKDEPDAPAAKSFSNHLSRVERGEETNPSLEFLTRTAKGLGLTLSTLLLKIEGALSDRDKTVGAPPFEHEVVVRADTAVPPGAFLIALADACAAAADATEREHLQAILDELVVAFKTASDATLVKEAREQVAAAKLRRQAAGDNGRQ